MYLAVAAGVRLQHILLLAVALAAEMYLQTHTELEVAAVVTPLVVVHLQVRAGVVVIILAARLQAQVEAVAAIIRVVVRLQAEAAEAILPAAAHHLVEAAEVLAVEVVEVQVAVEGNINEVSCINAICKSIGAIFIPYPKQVFKLSTNL